MNIKILHGKSIIDNKISLINQSINLNLHYRENFIQNDKKLSELNIDDLIVIEHIFNGQKINDIFKQNVIGCWNSECNSIIYSSHKSSFNQSIISEEMKKKNREEKIDMTLLLGDNLYERPKFIELKSDQTDIIDEQINAKKIPKNYKSIINNGFECFKNAMGQNHPFYAILGNHDDDENVIKYEVGLTYKNCIINNNILTSTTGWIMPEEFYVLKINNWHYLMLNSNFINILNIDAEIKKQTYDKLGEYQQYLIELYLKTYESTIEDKHVIVCLHEPFYAIGHKDKTTIIDNRNTDFYKSLMKKYNKKIHSILCADEHDTQHLFDCEHKINHIVASGAPYSGGDLLFREVKCDEKFNILKMYNSNILVTNVVDKINFNCNFHVINQLYAEPILRNHSITFDQFILNFNKNKGKYKTKEQKGKMKDKENKNSTDQVTDQIIDPITIQKNDLMTQINNECKKFSDKYEQLIRYVNVSDKFKSDRLIVNYSQEEIDGLEIIYQNIIQLIDELNALK